MNHTWKIYDLNRVTDTGVVNKVIWGVESFDSASNINDRHISELTLTGSTTDPGFIAYDDLTEETVLGWVTSSVPVEEVESGASASIASIVAAQAAITESSGTPW